MRRPLLRYAVLSAACLAGLAFTAAPSVAEDELPHTSEFFDEYDTNADGKVVQDEFRGSGEIFRLLDKNGDGAVTPDELGLPADYKPDPQARARKGAQGRGGEREGAKGKGKGADGRGMERLLAMDTDGDKRVSRAEWKGPPDAFDRFDGNKDGFLDAQDGAAGRMDGDRKAKGDRKGKGDRRAKGEGAGEGMDEGHDAEELKARTLARFAEIDKDGDGRLTAEELPAPRLLELADADKDGAVTAEEFVAFTQRRGRSGQTSPAAPAQGGEPRMSAGTLRRWDGDGDGRVSREEFPGRAELFDRLDADADGFLTPADIAQKKAAGDAPDAPPTTPRTGTLIEQMDTDGDGRLHRAEFKGSAGEWRRLDRNQDGWVTADELDG
ncbi:MAG: EF-hand domain-containing protein [Planctomycetota bacterium]|nr:EF-hand domain-containing protein [Planctomycetota bacterium]